jgi:hypothetical protein
MGSLVFLNLFIGVVTAGMANASIEMAEDILASERIKRLQVTAGKPLLLLLLLLLQTHCCIHCCIH